MSEQYVNELRLMFLEQIATETPEAAAALFEMRDAQAWQDKYKVSAGWLDSFLRAVIEHGQKHMDWVASLRYPDLQISSAAAAWLRIVTLYKAGQEIGRAIEKAAPDRITYLDPREDKRRPSRQCCWLVSWLFAGMSDERLRQAAGVGSWQIVQRTRTAFARAIELKLGSQRGRRSARA